ncbi:hypothetical protein [Amycolatopsis panacis]|uniref:Uncharacterized protein n=1 Tax=Amycolatopsis panacis TaxID=2340917 RepID=A0A419I3J3_9PSEU|nr:hypothetical protein [Amycolatopsis panacis]RJQ84757.1 hypothetical protein D5S19_15950 [Amycolatopsis panacis]
MRSPGDRTWMTWQEAYCEAVAHDARAALRGYIVLTVVLAGLVVLVPSPWTALPAGAAGVWVAVRALRWSRLLFLARAGRLYPPR